MDSFGMIAEGVAAVLAVAALVFAYKVYQQASAEARLLLNAYRLESEEWGKERRELLSRIQHPEVVHHAPVEGFDAPEAEADDLEAVGRIDYDPNYEYDSALADGLTALAWTGPDGD